MGKIYVRDLVEIDRNRSGSVQFPDGVQRLVTLRCSQWSALHEIVDAEFVPLKTMLQDSLSHTQEFPTAEGEEVAIREGLEMTIEVYLASMRAEFGAHANVNDPRLHNDIALIIEGDPVG